MFPQFVICLIYLFIYLFIETESWCIAQISLQLLGSSDPPALAFWTTETTGMCHHSFLLLNSISYLFCGFIFCIYV
jgi:hypothetical protein